MTSLAYMYLVALLLLLRLCNLSLKGTLGSHLDRHEDIGRGQIGITAFQEIVNEPRLDNIPLILETPGR